MTQRYGTVHSRFWTDEKVQGWNDRHKLAALYLLTGPHATIAGAMRLPLQYMAADLGWSSADCLETVSRLSEDGFLTYDQRSFWCVVTKRLEYDAPKNPASLQGVIKVLDDMPLTHPGWPALFVILQALTARFRKVKLPWTEEDFRQSADSPETVPEQCAASAANSRSLQPRKKEQNPAALQLVADLEKAAPNGTDQQGYRWQGRIVRLKLDDYDRWEKSYSAIELDAQLRSLDDWLSGLDSSDDRRKRWFHCISGALKNRHEDAIAKQKLEAKQGLKIKEGYGYGIS